MTASTGVADEQTDAKPLSPPPIVIGLAAGIAVLIGAGVVVNAAVRGPWLDELWSWWFTESPTAFAERFPGDPHSATYYIGLLAVRSVTDSWYVARILTLGLFTAIALVLSWAVVGLRRWRVLVGMQTLCLAAAVGSHVLVQWGGDLRMYGALGVVAALMAATVITWERDPNFGTANICALILLAGFLALIDTWGALAAFGYLPILICRIYGNRANVALRTWLAAGCTAALVIVALWLSYRNGLLASDETRQVGLKTELSLIKSAISVSAYVLGLMVFLWVLSWVLITMKKLPHRSPLLLELPPLLSMTVAFLAGAVSGQSTFKEFSLTPVICVALVALIVRAVEASSALAVVTLVVLAVNGAITLPQSAQARQDWVAGAAYLSEHRDRDDSCPVLVYPGGDMRFTRLVIPPSSGVPLEPLETKINKISCESGWIVVNNTRLKKNRERVAKLLDRFGSFEVLWKGAGGSWVGRYKLPER